jgi:hypothetical protein
MRALLIIPILFAACSAPWHLQKAIKKQPDIINAITDTITTWVNVKDTIWTERGYIVRDTMIEIQTITNTVYIHPKSRFDYKSERDSLRHVLAMEKQHTKQARLETREEIKKAKEYERTKRTEIRVENRSNWWVWFVVGFVVGVLIRFLWNKRPFILPL